MAMVYEVAEQHDVNDNVINLPRGRFADYQSALAEAVDIHRQGGYSVITS